MSLTPPGQQGLSTLRFALGWADISRSQQQLLDAVATALQATDVPAVFHQRLHSIPQRRGGETWRRYTHMVHVAPQGTFLPLETSFSDLIRRLHHTILARYTYTDATRSEVTIVVGIVGVPTDIFILSRPHSAKQPLATSAALLPSHKQPEAPPRSIPQTPYPLPKSRSRIAIVIDDLGWDLEAAMTLLALEAPLSFAILPDAPHRVAIAREAQRRGRDVLLHMPMEPHHYPQVNPGKSALLSSMNADEITAHLDAALTALPAAGGMNNHMGSLLTENQRAMQIVMRHIKRRNLFFLDSRTTRNSLAYQIAQQMGIPAAQRQVFLDHAPDPGSIQQQLRHLTRLAHIHGSAIGIGHPYPATVQVLRTMLPTLRQDGITVVPVSVLVR